MTDQTAVTGERAGRATLAGAERRLRILLAIADHWAARGYGPSMRQLCAAAGTSSSGVLAYHLRRLRRAGLIDMDDGVCRSIRLRRTEPSDDRPA